MGFSGAAGLGRLPWLWNWFFWSFIGLYWTVSPRGTPRMPKSSFISFTANGTVSPLESVPPLTATEPDSPPDPNWDFSGINFVQIMSLDWSPWQIKAPVLALHRNCWNPAHFEERSADFHQREKGSFPVLVLIHQRSPANSCLLFLFFLFFFLPLVGTNSISFSFLILFFFPVERISICCVLVKSHLFSFHLHQHHSRLSHQPQMMLT